MSNRLAVTLCTSLPRVFYSPSLVTLSHSPAVTACTVSSSLNRTRVERRPLSIATVVTCFKPFTNTCILSHQVCLKDCVVCNNRLYQRRRYTYPVTYIHSRARSEPVERLSLPLVAAVCDLYQIVLQLLPPCLTLALHSPRCVRSRRRSSVHVDAICHG